MSEDIAPKRRGRPPGSKNKPKEAPPVSEAAKAKPKYKMKAKPNWTEDDIDTLPDDTPDRLRIEPHLVPEGMSLQWVTTEVYGQPMPQRRALFEKRGWTPVHQEDFDGVFDGMFMPKGADGEIKIEGMVLMARPSEMTRKARLMDKFNADEKIRIKERELLGGGLNTPLDSMHPSALKTNKIGRSMERIEVPKD